MIYPESRTYDLTEDVDLTHDVALTHNLDFTENFQAMFNYLFDIQALPLTRHNKSYNFTFERVDTL